MFQIQPTKEVYCLIPESLQRGAGGLFRSSLPTKSVDLLLNPPSGSWEIVQIQPTKRRRQPVSLFPQRQRACENPHLENESVSSQKPLPLEGDPQVSLRASVVVTTAG